MIGKASDYTVYKTSINLPQDAVDTIRALAQQRGTTMAEVIRQAISTEKFIAETTSTGGKVLIQEADKTIRQIVFK